MGIVRAAKSLMGQYLITKEYLNDPELSKKRLETCNSCKFNNNGECKLCGCIIAVKVLSKVSINLSSLQYEQTHCPSGKWPYLDRTDLEITNHYRILNNKTPLSNEII